MFPSLIFGASLVASAAAAALPQVEVEYHSFSSYNDTSSRASHVSDLRARALGWTVEIITMPASARLMPGSDISVISRAPDKIDLFAIVAPEESPLHLWWTDGENWDRDYMWVYGDGAQPQPGPGIAAVARRSDRQEVFYGQPGGEIRSRYWTPQGKWNLSHEKKAKGSMRDKSNIVALSRYADHMEIFYLSNGNKGVPNGKLMHSYSVNEGGDWVIDQPVDNDATAAIDGSLAGLSRNRDHMAIFWVTASGGIDTMDFNSATGWQRRTISSSRSVDMTGTPYIAALARSDSNMNVFYVGNDRKIHQAWWSVDKPEWTPSAISDIPAAVPASIAAVSMNRDHQEVFWMGTDGSIKHAYWTATQKTWKSETLTGTGGSKACAPGTKLSLVARENQRTMEGWCRARDNQNQLLHFYYYY